MASQGSTKTSKTLGEYYNILVGALIIGSVALQILIS